MSERAERLKPLLAELSPEERAELFDYLRALQEEANPLTPEEWEDAWVEEINRRTAEIDSGTAKLVPLADVLRRLDEKLK